MHIFFLLKLSNLSREFNKGKRERKKTECLEKNFAKRTIFKNNVLFNRIKYRRLLQWFDIFFASITFYTYICTQLLLLGDFFAGKKKVFLNSKSFFRILFKNSSIIELASVSIHQIFIWLILMIIFANSKSDDM